MPPNEMTPQELIAELRSRINPLYASQMGTESYERRLCAEALEAQADQINEARNKLAAWMLKRGYPTGHGDTVDQLMAELTAELDKALKPIAWRYTDSFGTHFTEDRREVFNNPKVETWTTLYGEEH